MTSHRTTGWGASPSDWQRLADLGLLADLLPVVSDPQAKISPISKLKQTGKIPSRYVSDDLVAGFANWTGRITNTNHLAQWSSESNYGICVQTRNLRALDIDIDDHIAAAFIEAAVRETLGEQLPKRYRNNSGKCLLAFRLSEGASPWTKRILRVEGGIVEFLATGQQFVAFGTHPSGERYEWAGLPEPVLGEEFPLLDPETFENLWSVLVREFATADAVIERPARALTQPRRANAEHDPVREYLHSSGWVLSTHHDGRLNVACPFEGEHTGERNETATQYFPRNTGGFEQGHFRCLHAHCSGRADDDFLREIGYTASLFDEITEEQIAQEVAEADAPQPPSGLARNPQGRILPRVSNLVLAMRTPEWFGYEIRQDTFKDEVMLRRASEEHGWRTLTDADYVMLRMHLESTLRFLPIGRELIRDTVLMVASQNVFDSAVRWVETLPPWDGVPRVEQFLTRCAGAMDTSYTRAVSRYLWTAMAGRVLAPGCQVDMVPIFVGAQGVGKTTLVRELVPSPEFYMEAALDTHDAELARRMRGKLIAEIGELRGLRSREIEAIKAFITRTHEQWVPKYREFATTYPRRLVFVGTTNEQTFLADETGNRRWLPVRVTRGDVPALRRDKEQLWAEGVALWKEQGVLWREAHENADEARRDHSVADEWGPAIERWLNDDCGGDVVPPAKAEAGFTTTDVLVGAIGFDTRHIKRSDEMRVSGVLREAGFSRVRVMVRGSRQYRWVADSAFSAGS